MQPAECDKEGLSANGTRLVRIFLLVVLCSFAFPHVTAFAESFRCGSRIISTGDRKYEVLVKCGKPDFRDVRLEKRIKRDFFRSLFPRTERESELYREPLFVEEIVEIEEWVYNPGPTGLIRYLTFEDGFLVDIETGNYGY